VLPAAGAGEQSCNHLTGQMDGNTSRAGGGQKSGSLGTAGAGEQSYNTLLQAYHLDGLSLLSIPAICGFSGVEQQCTR
jgi:hypothetical protein